MRAIPPGEHRAHAGIFRRQSVEASQLAVITDPTANKGTERSAIRLHRLLIPTDILCLYHDSSAQGLRVRGKSEYISPAYILLICHVGIS